MWGGKGVCTAASHLHDCRPDCGPSYARSPFALVVPQPCRALVAPKLPPSWWSRERPAMSWCPTSGVPRVAELLLRMNEIQALESMVGGGDRARGVFGYTKEVFFCCPPVHGIFIPAQLRRGMNGERRDASDLAPGGYILQMTMDPMRG